MFDRRLIEYFDWVLLGVTLLLGLMGMGILYSAVAAGEIIPNRVLFIKQLIWFGAGLVLMFFSFLINYKNLDRWGIWLYIASIALLASVLVFGKLVGGSQRWLVLGPVTMQPSEIAKLAVIIFLAKYYAKYSNINGMSLRELIKPFLIVLIPFMLIVKQPDLGTAMLIVLIAASMTIFVRIERRTLISIMSVCIVTIPLIWFLLKGYQKQRILTFLNPDRDPLGAGYHIIQSKIAIGSGMITGKGFLKGTQNVLSFLPEQHTDFILSVLAEEWGFVGTGLIVLIYLLLIVWGLNIAHGCREPFGVILSVGITSMLFWQVFINIAMVMGLMPVVGVPLPLISYGGSSVITTIISIGILININMRRFMVD
ncbi:MAG: rod shape-determining protein RodA [Proteobacteria bacterium]|nr:rod shape-determining protein RodA [Pseudomonadota bacterium]